MDWQMGWSLAHHLDLPKDSTMVEQKETHWEHPKVKNWVLGSHWGCRWVPYWEPSIRLVQQKAWQMEHQKDLR